MRSGQAGSGASCQDVPRRQAGASSCPRCGGPGHRVEDRTIEAILNAEDAQRLLGEPGWFCGNRECRILYFTRQGQVVEAEHALVRVGLKQRVGPVTLCYCFGHTLEDIREEIRRTGECTIPARVAAEIRAGRCACEVKNPSGRCCLGELRSAVETEMRGARE